VAPNHKKLASSDVNEIVQLPLDPFGTNKYPNHSMEVKDCPLFSTTYPFVAEERVAKLSVYPVA